MSQNEEIVLDYEIDPEQASERTFDLIPNGWQYAQASRISSKDTRTGGVMIEIGYEILTGPHEGRWIYNNYNVRCANPDAERYAREDLASLAKATIKRPTQRLNDVLEIPLWIKVGVEKSKDPQYGDKNKVVAYSDHDPTNRSRGGQRDDRRGAPPPRDDRAPARDERRAPPRDDRAPARDVHDERADDRAPPRDDRRGAPPARGSSQRPW